MQIQALLNTTNIHNSPCVERFYRLNTSIQRRPSQPLLRPILSCLHATKSSKYAPYGGITSGAILL
ncbi:hypothetical protein B0H67DRAFT_350985 [Lasiosphaeris hirsuta]|uniref:Uncharacterized protein n=1 Tax=Lasiosphaeris hirsuta TaxID=260670 RepID=A0AA39ZVT6_9PEZI|nr:hypothetical protein B0H67DRAFT_350985 [Lasiosphaeris hirsuta]